MDRGLRGQSWHILKHIPILPESVGSYAAIVYLPFRLPQATFAPPRITFSREQSALLGESGALHVPAEDRITYKLAMLLEGECGGLGPTAAARKYEYTKQRYRQLRARFQAHGAVGLQDLPRGPKTDYRRTDERVIADYGLQKNSAPLTPKTRRARSKPNAPAANAGSNQPPPEPGTAGAPVAGRQDLRQPGRPLAPAPRASAPGHLDLLCGWPGAAPDTVEPRLARQLVPEAALAA